MSKLSELMHKKVLGIPVAYLGLAAAVALAYFAWKMKTSTPEGTGDGTADGSTAAESGSGGSANDQWAGLQTTGTVVVQPTTVPVNAVTEQTNQQWLQTAIDYLVNDAKKATYVDAQRALSKYIDGEDLTYEESELVNVAVAKNKMPPEGVSKIGSVGSKPAQKQFSNFPGKHTVNGVNDNTMYKLAGLYYGVSDGLHADRIAEYNTTLGPVTTTLSSGTVVTIPAYTTPAYYKVTGKNGDTSVSYIASKHGLTVAQVQALNPGLTYPVAINTKVRTQ